MVFFKNLSSIDIICRYSFIFLFIFSIIIHSWIIIVYSLSYNLLLSLIFLFRFIHIWLGGAASNGSWVLLHDPLSLSVVSYFMRNYIVGSPCTYRIPSLEWTISFMEPYSFKRVVVFRQQDMSSHCYWDVCAFRTFQWRQLRNMHIRVYICIIYTYLQIFNSSLNYFSNSNLIGIGSFSTFLIPYLNFVSYSENWFPTKSIIFCNF